MTTSYLFHHACLTCRRSFKRPGARAGVDDRRCPGCGNEAINLGRHFKPPQANDIKGWELVTFLVHHGFVFQKIFKLESSEQVGYPANLRAAKDFVRRYRAQSIDPQWKGVKLEKKKAG
jgi:hypothetical protein